MSDTIFALSTAAGKAGIAVIRMSGPAVPLVIEKVVRRKLLPRNATYARLWDDRDGVMDDAVAIYFKAPHSFTGEDIVEFHIHGGRAVIQAVASYLARFPFCRIAEPGEFTKRAFYNGKLNLTEVEGLSDLINAETDAQRKQALRQLSGELGQLYDNWRTRLIRALAHYEAAIDFPDEGLDPAIEAKILVEGKTLAHEIETHLKDNRRGEILREGMQVAIIGEPNVGKSSLLNGLARREAAIVSHHAGTTRDVIEVHMDLGGYPLVLADTAGIRDTTEEIEAEGIRRSITRAEQSDAKLLVLDASTTGGKSAVIPADLRSYLGPETILIWNKIDLLSGAELSLLNAGALEAAENNVFLSIKTGDGMKDLEAMLQKLADQKLYAGNTPTLTRLRHREELAQVLASITRFVVAESPELAAEDLRLAVRHLGKINGSVDVEDILDVIFRDFCIGK